VGGLEIKGGSVQFEEITIKGDLVVYGNMVIASTATDLIGTSLSTFTVNNGGSGNSSFEFNSSSTYIAWDATNSRFNFSNSIYIDVSSNSAHWDSAYSATNTATNANTGSTLVKRDASGNFSAGMITANLTGAVTGNASTATTLQTARTIGISGNVTGTGVSFNGGADITITTAIASNVITNAMISSGAAIVDTKLATISTAGKVSGTAITSGDISTTGSFNTSGTITIGSVKINDEIRIEEIIPFLGLAQDTPHEIPGGKTYNAWLGTSGTGNIFQTNKTLTLFVDGRLQRPGDSYDYVECGVTVETAVAQYASTKYVKFKYDLAEGSNVTYIIKAV